MESGDETTTKPTSPPETSRPGTKALLEPLADVIRPELAGIDAAGLEQLRGGVGDEGLVEVEDDRENGGFAAHHS